MSKLRQHNIFRIVWMVMALHILNFSIDAPDAQDDAITEDLSYNDIESFTEWFTEDVLNIKDAFEETDEQGDENSGFIKKVVDVKFHQVHFDEEIIPVLLSNIKNNSTKVHYSEPFCATNYISIFSPPPEA
jgi:hypothetical protein